MLRSPLRSPLLGWVAAGVLMALSVTVIVLLLLAGSGAAGLGAIRLATSYVAVIVAVPFAIVSRAAPARLVALGAVGWMLADLSALYVVALDAHGLAPWSASAALAGRAMWAASSLAALGAITRVASARRITDSVLFAMVVLLGILTITQWQQRAGATFPGSGYVLAVTAVDGIYVVLAVLAAAGATGWQRRPYQVMAASCLVLAGTDMISYYGDLFGMGLPGWALDLGWSAQNVVRTIGLLSIASRVRRGHDSVDTTFREARLLLPMVLLVMGYAVATRPLPTWPPTSVALALLICAFVVAREIMISAEQRELASSEARATAELQHQAEYDDLTGLYRRNCVFDQLNTALDAGRQFQFPVAVISVDLDRFKEVNDTFGHGVGDQVLRGLAANLSTSAPDDVVGRLGGDEFVIVHSPVESISEVSALRERITHALTTPIEVADGASIKISGSMGVAVIDPGNDGVDAGQAIAQADLRAYEVKRRHPRPKVRRRMPDRQFDPTEIRSPLAALDEGRLSVWYQPIVALDDERIVGAEALVRLIEIDGTVRAANQFLPFLTAAGRGDEVTKLVVRQSFRQFATGPFADLGLLLSINLSERDLADERALELVRQELAETGLPAERLIVEIDEHVTPGGPLIDTLAGLRALGVTLALDDFGARSSTFGQIAHLAPSFLKLDVGLVPRGGPHPETDDWQLGSIELANAFTRLAHHLDIKVIAEGIERPAQRARMREIGCDFGQGFLWSRAVPAEQLVRGPQLAGTREPVPDRATGPVRHAGHHRAPHRSGRTR